MFNHRVWGYHHIGTWGSIVCDWNFTASNLYTIIQVGTLLAPKATKTYVDDQLTLKASQSDVNTALALKATEATTYT